MINGAHIEARDHNVMRWISSNYSGPDITLFFNFEKLLGVLTSNIQKQTLRIQHDSIA